MPESKHHNARGLWGSEARHGICGRKLYAFIQTNGVLDPGGEGMPGFETSSDYAFGTVQHELTPVKSFEGPRQAVPVNSVQ